MQLYQLHQFLAVADTGSFTKAAGRLNVAQPALSIGIGKLEKELSVILFDRSGPRVTLTRSGYKLLNDAREIIQKCADIRKTVQTSSEHEAVKIGILRTIPARIVSEVFQTLAADHPKMSIETIDGGHEGLISMLKRGRVQALMTVSDGLNPAHSIQTLYEERYVALFPKKHKLAARKMMELEEFRDEPFILRTSCEIFIANQELFSSRGVRVKNVSRTDQDDRTLMLVESGSGSTIMPETFRSPHVAQLKISGYNARRRICLVHMANQINPVISRVAASLVKHFSAPAFQSLRGKHST